MNMDFFRVCELELLLRSHCATVRLEGFHNFSNNDSADFNAFLLQCF